MNCAFLDRKSSRLADRNSTGKIRGAPACATVIVCRTTGIVLYRLCLKSYGEMNCAFLDRNSSRLADRNSTGKLSGAPACATVLYVGQQE